MSRVDQQGRVAFLCMLMINLCLAPFYQLGCAQPASPAMETSESSFAVRYDPPACPEGVLPDPIPQALQDIFDAQENIYSQLWPVPSPGYYQWCYGVGWQLSDEVLEGPTDPWTPIVISAETGQHDDLWVEVYEVIRITDFTEADLTPEQRALVEQYDLALGIMGANITGPLGSVEVWGFTQAITHPTLGRLVNFTPLVEAPVIPPANPSQWQCENAPPGCLENARGCLDVCLGNKTDLVSWALGVWYLEALVAYLICLGTAPIPVNMAWCALRVGGFNLVALVVILGAYALARQHCHNAYAQNVTNCCDGFMMAPCQ